MTDPHVVYYHLNGFNETRPMLLPLITMNVKTNESLTANYTQPRTEAKMRCILRVDTELHREGNEFQDYTECNQTPSARKFSRITTELNSMSGSETNKWDETLIINCRERSNDSHKALSDSRR